MGSKRVIADRPCAVCGVVFRPPTSVQVCCSKECVHHKNGRRNDNRIENLELWVVNGRSKKDPLGQRLEDVLADLLTQPELDGMQARVESAFRRVFKIEACHGR